jgi:hypothetical protein
MICAKSGWNWPSGSGEEVENVKSLQTDGQTVRRTHMEVLVIKITCELQKVQTLFVRSTSMSVKCGVTEKLKLWKEMSMTCVVNRLRSWAAPLKMKNISNSYMYHSIVHYFKLINNFQVVVKTYGFHTL